MNKRGIATALVLAIIFGLTTVGLGSYIVYDNVKTNTSNSTTVTESSEVNNQDNQTQQDTYNTTDIKVFWTNFRSAVISGNYDEIKKYVNFPLLRRGELDTDQTYEVGELDFQDTFEKYLHEDNGLGENKNNLDWIIRNEMPEMKSGAEYDNANDYKNIVRLSEGEADFSNMVIKTDSNGNWKLTLIYLAE